MMKFPHVSWSICKNCWDYFMTVFQLWSYIFNLCLKTWRVLYMNYSTSIGIDWRSPILNRWQFIIIIRRFRIYFVVLPNPRVVVNSIVRFAWRTGRRISWEVQIITSPLVLFFCENDLERSCRTVTSKSPNEHSHLYMRDRPLEEAIQDVELIVEYIHLLNADKSPLQQMFTAQTKIHGEMACKLWLRYWCG